MSTDKCRRLKEILQGKTIDCLGLEVGIVSAGRRGEHTASCCPTRRTSIADKLQQNAKNAKVQRLSDILREGCSHGVNAVGPVHNHIIAVPPHSQLSNHQSPFSSHHSSPSFISNTQTGPGNNETVHSERVDRLRHLLLKGSVASKALQHSAMARSLDHGVVVPDAGNNRAVKSYFASTIQDAVAEGLAAVSQHDSVLGNKLALRSCVSFSKEANVVSASEDSMQEPQGRARTIRRVPKYRLAPNTRTEVVVVGVRSNGIYVQEVPLLHELVNMMRALQSTAEMEPQVMEIPKPKTYVAALRPDDKTWYRAEVKRGQRHSIEVLYVDYGNRGTVTAENLKTLPKPFLDIPAFATSVRLHGIDKIDSGVVYFLQRQIFQAEVIDCVEEKQCVVKLFEKESKESINDMLKELMEISEGNVHRLSHV